MWQSLFLLLLALGLLWRSVLWFLGRCLLDGGWEVVGYGDWNGGEEGLEIWELEGRDCCRVEREDVDWGSHVGYVVWSCRVYAAGALQKRCWSWKPCWAPMDASVLEAVFRCVAVL